MRGKWQMQQERRQQPSSLGFLLALNIVREARTRRFASPTIAGCAFIAKPLLTFDVRRQC